MDKPNYLQDYLATLGGASANPASAAYYASLDQVAQVNPLVVQGIVGELRDQRRNLKLIASENYSSLATQLAMGNLLTDKYAEGFPMHRFYAGCDNVDLIESEAANKAKELFGADHAYVQPHSGADANMVAFTAILLAKVQTPALERLKESNPSNLSREDWETVREEMHRQKLVALDYYSGGHLTHGYRHNFSAQMFDVDNYSVDKATGLVDLEALREQLHRVKPLIFLTGYSAYPRSLNFRKMREMADEVGAVFMVDMAHFAGLVAGKVFKGDFDPVAHAHVVTTTTHKTLRGPRGGMVLCKAEFAEYVDKGCPAILGGPLPHMMAAKAVAFTEALKPEFSSYAAKIVENSQAFAKACVDLGMPVATGGTDNHLFLVDVQKGFGLTGRQAESALRECAITLNRNSLPFDANGPWYTSGLRLGTAAVTTLGMGPAEMQTIANILHMVLSNLKPAIIEKGANQGKPSKANYVLTDGIQATARQQVAGLLNQFPLYPELDLDFLLKPWGLK
ncbi:MAG: glycine hydroxymethyltransferase [bacterium]|nr:glycine hydroxymethyltransferase [bacterium]